MNTSDMESVGKMTNIYNSSMMKYYNFLLHELGDPRTKDYFLISSPVLFASILGGYLYFTLSWGPKYMEHRKPYDLKKVLILYNMIQICVSIWIVWEGLDCAWLRDYSWKCQPVETSLTPKTRRVLRVIYLYFLCKISEFLDTIFFVFRKKNNQISFLHVYHHTSMALGSWGVVKYYPGGHVTFIGLINSFVHIIMYAYYLLSAVVPQKYLWWKKYITTLQLSQFGIATLHSSQLLIYDCNFPKWSLILIIPNAVFFTFMFLDFYIRAYAKNKTSSDASKTRKENEISNSSAQKLEKDSKTQTAKGKTE